MCGGINKERFATRLKNYYIFFNEYISIFFCIFIVSKQKKNCYKKYIFNFII